MPKAARPGSVGHGTDAARKLKLGIIPKTFQVIQHKDTITKTEEESADSSSVFMVPMIGVEPTRREALAPETSVSTISPHGLEKVATKI